LLVLRPRGVSNLSSMREPWFLRIRWASSIQAIVMAVLSNDLKPSTEAQHRLIVRRSCSMRLLRYLFGRCQVKSLNAQ